MLNHTVVNSIIIENTVEMIQAIIAQQWKQIIELQVRVHYLHQGSPKYSPWPGSALPSSLHNYKTNVLCFSNKRALDRVT